MSNNVNNTRPSRLEKRLHVSVALFSLLGTFLLGMGQMDYFLPKLVLLTATTSLLITDFKRWVQIGGLVANTAALIAVGFSVNNYLVFDTESQLLAIAHLLVYLQIILQFQAKTVRIYWQLVMLSLLQVVVACALNLGVLFGVLLVVYLCCSLRVLMLLHTQREALRYTTPTDENRPVQETGQKSGQRTAWMGETLVGQIAGPGVNRSMWKLIALSTALTALVTVLIFSTVPRYHREAWQGFAAPAVRVVGYSEQVTVGDLGPVIQNPQVVMRVQLIDPDNNQPFSLSGRPLFRGGVLSDYQGHGVWRRTGSRRVRQPLDTAFMGQVSADELVRQEITMPRSESDVIFSIYPPVSPPDEPADRFVRYDYARNQIFRTNHDSHRHGKTQYVVHTLGIRDDDMAPIAPTLAGDRRSKGQVNTQLLRELGTDRSKLSRLIALAERIDRSSGLPEDDRVGRARAIARHFSASGNYTYTLQPQQRDADLDPIEDFIANTRRGHCEYYASALTLMLRSRDIPARMVIGFVGDEWNEFGAFYQVRQLHAHTWVEVFIPPDQLPEEPYYQSPHFAAGGWLTLDPTPGGSDGGVTLAGNQWYAGLRKVFDYAQLLWTSYVVDMTPRRQNDAIYEPIRARWAELTAPLDELFGNDESAQSDSATGTSTVMENWGGLLVGMLVTSGLLVLLILLCRPLRSRVVRLLSRLAHRSPRHARHQQTVVPFYRKLEEILAREGIRRKPSQTQREFAFDAGAQLADRASLGAVAGLPRQLVDTFYRVRFGGHALDNKQAQAVEQALSQLGRALDGHTKS